MVVGRIHFLTDVELVAAHFFKASRTEVEISSVSDFWLLL